MNATSKSVFAKMWTTPNIWDPVSKYPDLDSLADELIVFKGIGLKLSSGPPKEKFFLLTDSFLVYKKVVFYSSSRPRSLIDSKDVSICHGCLSSLIHSNQMGVRCIASHFLGIRFLEKLF